MMRTIIATLAMVLAASAVECGTCVTGLFRRMEIPN
jgi:hypothetical protein